MTYTVQVHTEEDLRETWTHPVTECWLFVFNEQSLDECVEVSPGVYEATYDTIELTEATEYTRYDPASGTTFIETILPGEYGIKPTT